MIIYDTLCSAQNLFVHKNINENKLLTAIAIRHPARWADELFCWHISLNGTVRTWFTIGGEVQFVIGSRHRWQYLIFIEILKFDFLLGRIVGGPIPFIRPWCASRQITFRIECTLASGIIQFVRRIGQQLQFRRFLLQFDILMFELVSMMHRIGCVQLSPWIC